jgi:hypothetical protein
MGRLTFWEPDEVFIHAGASVPKTVYVSKSTPFMSAVKRVQKLLLQAEKHWPFEPRHSDGKAHVLGA